MKVSSPFGSQTRTRLLLALELLGQSYPRELARLLGVSLSSVQKGLASLDRDALIASRLMGRTRVSQLNPRYFAEKQLRAFIARLAAEDRDLKARIAALRRRPRRVGKPL